MNGMQEENSAGFDIQKYLGILQKRKYLALSVAVAVMSVLTWGGFFWPKSYEASSTVFVEQSSVLNPLIQGAGVSTNLENRLKNLQDRVTSRNIIERVAKKLDLDVKGKSDQYEAFIADVQKNLNVKVKGVGRTGPTDLFVISYKGQDPKRVSDVVNTLVHEFIEESLGYSRDDTYGAYTFIESQLQEYRKQLDDSDRVIREFRENNPQMVPRNEATVMTRIEGFETAKIESEIKMKELLKKRENIRNQLSGGRLSSLNNQLLQLLTKYTEDYPEVVKVKNEIEELKKQKAQAASAPADAGGAETATMNPVYQQLREEQARIDAEIESLRGRQAELERQQGVATSVLRRMPKEQEEWSRLQRDRASIQNIYNDLLKKREQARVSTNLEQSDKGSSFRIVDPALVPTMPATPNRVQLILLGIFLGLASGIGAAIGFDFLFPSFKDENALAAELKLPVFASIPQIVTEEDIQAEAKLDRKVFVAAGVYLFIICIVLVEEVLYRFMGINIVKF
jgi:succinoglycan biosynthesis transport protein ExoP